MSELSQPYHAHVYYELNELPEAQELNLKLKALRVMPEFSDLSYVGRLWDRKIGPHPLPQFEIHFTIDLLVKIRSYLDKCGFRVLIHPLISFGSLLVSPRIMMDIGQIISIPTCGPPIPSAALPLKKNGLSSDSTNLRVF